MKILMVLETKFPPDLRVENEVESLLQMGHKITVLSGSRDKKCQDGSYSGAIVKRHYIPTFIYKSSIGSINFPFYFYFWKSIILEMVKDGDFEAVHIHDLPLSSVVIGIKRRYALNFKIVLDLHENYPDMLRIAKHTNTRIGKIFFDYRQWLNYESRNVKKVDHVITVVEEMRKRVGYLGVPEEKITVVSNTFNSSKFNTPLVNPSQDKVTLFYGGGVTIDRGIQYIIPALKTISQSIPNLQLVIVGDGSYLNELKKLVKKLKVEEYVTFHGWQKFETLLDYLAQAHIALIPHIKSVQTESGLPHKLFQYMVTGVPIVASNCTPFVRILGDNNAGEIYQYDNHEEFAEKIIALYKNKTRQKELVANAKQLVQEKYLWEYDAKRLGEIYKM